MNTRNVGIMGVAAVVIVVCLLYSWVQYGDDGVDETQDETFDGTWYPVYSYRTGLEAEIILPESFEVVSGDGVVTMSAEGVSRTFTIVSDHEAVSSDGYQSQLYLEDGTLYLIQMYSDPDLHGLIYIAMSGDSRATLPSDPVDISGASYDVTVRMCNGVEFRETVAEGVLAVDTHSFHIAKGIVSFGSSDMSFTGFVKTDGTRVVVTGYSERDGGYYPFNMVLDDGAMFSATGSPGSQYTYAGSSDGFSTDMTEGEAVLGDETLEVHLEDGLVNIINDRAFYPGSVVWTLGDDLVLFGSWSVLAYDGSEYAFLAQNIMA